MNVAIASLRRPKAPLPPTFEPASDDDPDMIFRVELDAFRGPLDLLLFLVRKQEVEIVDLPIATITDQFVAYIDVLKEMNIDRIGEFLEMAGVLLEIKSRLVLPHADEVEEPLEDPRQDLVRQLLEYKKYRDAATMLEDRFRNWQDHFGRLATERAAASDEDLSHEPIREVELWDLVSAFARVMRDYQGGPQTSIKVDEVPIHVHMERIARQLNENGRVALGDLFEPGMQKTRLVGLFLAVLELVRHHDVRTEQNALFGEIYVFPSAAGQVTVDPTMVETYDATETTLAAEQAATRVDGATAAPPAPHEAAATTTSRAKKPR